MTSMKIVLTGSDGNLAQHIIRKSDGVSIEILPLNRSSWGEVDELMKKADAVLHAAGDIRTSLSSAPCKYVESNLLTTTKLLELCAKHSISKFYFVSSCAVYGDVNSSSESQQCYPISINGKFKKLNEDIISSYCQENSIEFSCFRVFNLFGGIDRFSIVNYLTEAARHGTDFCLNNEGLSQRDFIHVADVADIVLKMVLKGSCPPYINVGTGVTTKIVDLLNVVLKQYPDIKLKRTFNAEIEYSRADTSLLLESVGDIDFISILDHVKQI